MTTIDETRPLSDAERALTDDKARAERAAGTRSPDMMRVSAVIEAACV